MTIIVLSPAIVPSTSGRRAWSIACARAFACPGGVWITSRFADTPIDSAQRRSADVSSLIRSRSAPPGIAYTSRPDASRTFTSPSCAMSRDTVPCTPAWPTSRNASATSSCVDSQRSWTRRRIAPWRSNFVVISQDLLEDGEGTVELFVVDRQRRRQAQHPLACGTDEQAALEARGYDVARYAIDL